MIRLLLSVLIGLPLALVVIALALVNNQMITISLDPFTKAAPLYAISVPLYAFFFITLIIGIILGGIGAWARQGRFRKAARENRREAVKWRSHAERLESEKQPDGPVPGLPALPRR